jgi:multiple sugar transport system ATP-binding protein
MSAVVLERVNKAFPRPGGHAVQALHDFSLQVAERECVALLGPSGSGKTTALRLIAGLEEPTSGVISIGGISMDRVPPKDRDVAMVFQHHALYPHKTVRENFAFGLQLRKVPRAEIESRVRGMAELLGLATSLDVLPAQLSGGQRQRVALGRALIRRPKVLLCDEPLSQLDAPLRAQLRAELSRLRAQLAVTVVYVTHDQAEAMMLGDRIAVIEEGKLHQVDTPQRVYQEPADLFVAGFVGTPPMNLIQGSFVTRSGALHFQEGGEKAGMILPIDAGQTARFQSYVGRPIVLGLRPELIRWADEMAGSVSQGTAAVIVFLESTGPDVWLACDTGAHRLMVRAHESNYLRIGKRVSLVCDLSQARFFDPLTQQALT